MDNLLMMMCMAAVMVVITLIFSKSWKKKRMGGRKRSQLPRGRLGWPLIGETLEFMSCAYSPCPERFMDKRRTMYGKVFKSHIFGSPTIVSTEAEVNRFILQSDASIFVPSYPKSLTELMGKSSILSINGSLQRRVHGLIGAFLKSPSLKAQITLDMQNYLKASMACCKDDQLIHIQDETKQVNASIYSSSLPLFLSLALIKFLGIHACRNPHAPNKLCVGLESSATYVIERFLRHKHQK